MPLDTDAIFGVCYLSVAEFEATAAMFGVNDSLPVDQNVTKSYLAAASRWIEAKTNKTFIPDYNHIEQHTLNGTTGRIRVNNAPVLSISDFRILTGPTTFSPITTGNLFINNQENWVELLQQPYIFPGLSEVIIQITYKSTLNVKQNIKLATGYVAAAMINQGIGVAQSLPGNITSIQIGSMAKVTAAASGKSTGSEAIIPDIVNLLLAADITIGIS